MGIKRSLNGERLETNWGRNWLPSSQPLACVALGWGRCGGLWNTATHYSPWDCCQCHECLVVEGDLVPANTSWDRWGAPVPPAVSFAIVPLQVSCLTHKRPGGESGPFLLFLMSAQVFSKQHLLWMLAGLPQLCAFIWRWIAGKGQLPPNKSRASVGGQVCTLLLKPNSAVGREVQ